MPVNQLANLKDLREYVQIMLESESEGEATLWTNDIIDSFIKAEHDHLCSRINRAHEHFWTRSSTTDIVANQESYLLPADFRAMRFVEYRASAGANEWRPVRPLDEIRRRPEFHIRTGVGIVSPSLSDLTHYFRETSVRYYVAQNELHLVPFINANMTAGLRIWYDFVPASPTSETWVPFGDGTVSWIQGQHEIIAVGAAIRCKKREEVNDLWGDLYDKLWNELMKATENRVHQESRHGADLEGYY